MTCVMRCCSWPWRRRKYLSFSNKKCWKLATFPTSSGRHWQRLLNRLFVSLPCHWWTLFTGVRLHPQNPGPLPNRTTFGTVLWACLEYAQHAGFLDGHCQWANLLRNVAWLITEDYAGLYKKTGQDDRASVDAIGWTGDYGGQKNLMINPRSWHKIFKPRLAILNERIHQVAKFFFFHSCWNIEAVLPGLFEIGVDILNPIQPETMEIFKLKREYGRDIWFFGGLGTQQTLIYRTPQEVRAEVEACLQEMRTGGGFVISPAKEIMSNVSLKNALALIDSLRLQKFYIFSGRQAAYNLLCRRWENEQNAPIIWINHLAKNSGNSSKPPTSDRLSSYKYTCSSTNAHHIAFNNKDILRIHIIHSLIPHFGTPGIGVISSR